MQFTNFEQFWQFLSKELKTPKKFNTIQDKPFKAVFEVNRVRFIFDDQLSRVEYKKSFEECFNLYLTHAKWQAFRAISYNASYVFPILAFYVN